LYPVKSGRKLSKLLSYHMVHKLEHIELQFYLNHVQQYWCSAFPKLPSYQGFIQWVPSTIIPLCVYLKHCFGNCTGISFIDSTKIQVCHNRRISGHKVFQDLAQRLCVTKISDKATGRFWNRVFCQT
jgi:hypothetical protein